MVDINEMKKKKQQESNKQRDDNFNWELGGGNPKKVVAPEEVKPKDTSKAAIGGDVRFGGAKYQISKGGKAVGNKMEFPELGQEEKKVKQKEPDHPVSKANQSGQFVQPVSAPFMKSTHNTFDRLAAVESTDKKKEDEAPKERPKFNFGGLNKVIKTQDTANVDSNKDLDKEKERIEKGYKIHSYHDAPREE